MFQNFIGEKILFRQISGLDPGGDAAGEGGVGPVAPCAVDGDFGAHMERCAGDYFKKYFTNQTGGLLLYSCHFPS